MLWKLIKKLRRDFSLFTFEQANMNFHYTRHRRHYCMQSYEISGGRREFQFYETYPGYLFHMSCHVSFVICVYSPRIHFNLNLIFPTFLIPFGMDFISHFHHFTTTRKSFLLQKKVKVFSFVYITSLEIQTQNVSSVLFYDSSSLVFCDDEWNCLKLD